MDGMVPVTGAPRDPRGPEQVKSHIDQLAKDPDWNGGWYYDKEDSH